MTRLRTLAGWLHQRDIAAGYCLILIVTVTVVFAGSSTSAHRVVLDSSTNLGNLRSQPLLVLIVSAFVLASPWGLWVLPIVFATYASAQRWLGRSATVVVALIGHVFATVFVAVLLAAGVAQHQLSRRIAHEPDVGVSYGLAALLAVLVFRLPSPWRKTVLAGATLVLAGILGVSQTFTDLGHLLAWLLGAAMGLVGDRIARAAAAAAEAPYCPP